MGRITRREFASLCTGALAMGSMLATFPRVACAAVEATGGSSGQDSTDQDLTALSLSEASARIHSGSVTSTQLTKALLARIGIYNPKLDVYITVMADEALKQAGQLGGEGKARKFRRLLQGM